jgi:hypothetical protein
MNKLFNVEWGTVFRLKTLSHKTHTQTTVLCCLPTFPQSSSDKRRKATVILSPGRRTQTVDRVKTRCFPRPFSHRETSHRRLSLLGVRDLNI